MHGATSPTIPLTSTLPSVCWPPIPGARASQLLTQLLFLEQSQWLSPGRLREQQMRQLEILIEYAAEHSELYSHRIREAGLSDGAQLTAERFAGLPPLTRLDLQLGVEGLACDEIPPGHGQVSPRTTTGSTGSPVTVLGTDLTEFFWRALTLRDHLWHRRQFSRVLASIRYTSDPRAGAPHGMRREEWGVATQGVVATGPGALLSIATTSREQAEWLLAVQPDYLMSYPSALLAVADALEERGERLMRLEQIRTFGEVVDRETRESLEREFGVPLVDTYSAQEVGYLALQCPEADTYHVQAERLFVEVLDDLDRPCEPGQVGRVVVTDLHNFASPLIRYEIGDYAEVGEACACGRGLPALSRILGRARNMLTLPNGDQRWPAFGLGGNPEELPPFFQVQLIQRTLDTIDVNVVRPAPLTPDEQERAARYLAESLGHAFDFAFHHVDEIPRGPGGKFEDFRSEVMMRGTKA